MTIYPIAKINLGLNVVERRHDGYHNIETVFLPVLLNDELRVETMPHAITPSDSTNDNGTCRLSVSFARPEDKWQGRAEDNLVVKAYDLLAAHYDLPPLHISLRKQIPSQAGMGGGSADAAYTIRLINDYCRLGLIHEEMHHLAASIGADCAFFINPRHAYATGIGDKMNYIDDMCDKRLGRNPLGQLRGKYLALVKPDVSVSTKEAYAGIAPQRPAVNCLDAIARPMEEWRDVLVNDFEASIFPKIPVLAQVKQDLYDDGAVYAAMSGSGSTIFAIFNQRPNLTKYARHYNKVIAL